MVISKSEIVMQLLRRNRLTLLVTSFSGLLVGGLSAIFLAIITQSLANYEEINMLQSVLVFTAVCVLILGFKLGHDYLALRLSNRISNEIRIDLANTLANCSPIHIQQKGRSSLLSVLTYDIDNLSNLILSLPQMVANVTLLIGATIYLAYISDLQLFITVTLFLFVSVFIYVRFMSSTEVMFEESREQYEKIVNHFSDLIDGHKEIKMKVDLKDKLVKEYVSPASTRNEELELKAGMQHSKGLNFGQSIIYTLIGILMFLLPLWFEYQTEVILTYIVAILYLTDPLQSAIDNYPLISQTRLSIRRIEELKDELEKTIEDHQITESAPVQHEVDSFKGLELKNVEFSYARNAANGAGIENKTGEAGTPLQLGPFNLTFSRGEVVFLIGGNGSGKTTLAKIICGLYTSYQGSIVYGGSLLSSANIEEYRRNFSTVFSDFHILKSAPNIYDLEKLQKSDLVKKFSLDEISLKRGQSLIEANLSQGQKRRLALILSLTDSRPIHIFDEPGADLDPEFKEFFYKDIILGLKKQGKTVIIISHDDNYFDIADRLIKVRNGKIVSSENGEFF